MKKIILLLGLFILFIVVMTFPLVFKITTYLPGFTSTDEIYGSVWDSWRINYSWNNHLSFKSTDFISYPFGLNLFSSGYVAYISSGILYSLSIFTNSVLTYNLQIILNLFLCLAITYTLILYVTRSRGAALFGALTFGFSPYQFVRSWQHISLTYNYLIPLSCLAIIMLMEKPRNKQAFFLLAAILLTFSLDYAISYFTIISLVAFFVYSILFNWKRFFTGGIDHEKYFIFIKKFFIIVAIAAIISFPQFFPVIKNRILYSSKNPASAFNPYHRPFEDLFSQSAKPLSYLLPASVHPIFGKFTEQFIGSSLYGDSLTEHTLYLGWTPLILAFMAVRRWKKIRYKKRLLWTGNVNSHERGSPCSEDFYIGFFVFLAIVAWLFSQSPWWKLGPVKIYMPSFFMYKILPMFRAYCRFGIMVMLAVAVLAGFGLKFILGRFKTQKAKVTITALFCGLVLFEFWNWPPYKVIDVSKVPAVYYWLKEQPEDIAIAEYPLDITGPNEMYKFYQTKHEKKIINGTIPGADANKFAQSIIKLSDSKTAVVLKRIGVKYVIVHREDYLKTELIEDKEELEKIPKNSGLKFIRNFPPQGCPRKDIMCVQKTGPIDVYEVK